MDGRNTPIDNRTSRRKYLKATSAGALAASLGGCALLSGDEDNIGDTLKIGTLSSTEDPIHGIAIPRGAELAASEINENGGIEGADVEVIRKHTEADPAVIPDRYRELTLEEEVDLVLGPLSSEGALNLLPNIAEDEQLTINPAAAAPALTADIAENYEDYKYLFRTCMNGYFMGVSQLDFASAKIDELGWDSIALLSEDYEWTKAGYELFKAKAGDALGVDVVEEIRYAAGTEDFTSIYDNIENSGADAAFTITAYTTAGAVTQWGRQERPFEFVGTNNALQVSGLYDALDGMPQYSVGLNLGATPGLAKTDRTIPFQEAYRTEHDGLPTYPGYVSYDSVYMFKNAVAEAGSTDTNDLISALEQMEFEGSSGNIAFYGKDETGNFYDQEVTYTHDAKYGSDYLVGLWFQWQEEDGEGVQVPLYPDDLAQGEYQVPDWF